MPLQIKQLTQEDGAWHWTLVRIDEDLDTIQTLEMRTNQNGEGLWEWEASGAQYADTLEPAMEWRQTLGKCQFSLLGVTTGAARQRIRRQFADDYAV